MTDFDTPQDRSQSAAEKWDKSAMLKHFGRDDLLPFWVADMEFKAPSSVTESLVERAQNAIYGYEYRRDSLLEAITEWNVKRHHWNVNPSELCFSNNVMHTISILINQLTEKGDGIIVQPPVFFEFRLAILENKRKMIRNPLKIVDGHYEMDFDDLEKQAAKPRTKVMILCNPHNPVGRVWTEAELKRVGEICRKHDVFIISDEIHADITYSGHQYTPFISAVSKEISEYSAACLSPAKTFNIASVTDALAVIPDEKIRDEYKAFIAKYSLHKSNAFSNIAMETAYRTGENWLDELLEYLHNNLNFLRTYLKEKIPKVHLIEPEGTFLVWLDFNELGMDAKELESFLAQKARIALNSGYWFGRQGAGYARMTIACPQSMLEEGLSRLAKAVSAL